MGFLDIVTAPITQTANMLGNAYNDITGKTAVNMSAEAAERNLQKQIAWERERATSAHQWEVEDLKKAGLNPILSAGGSGAQTGSITPQMPDISQYKGAGALLQIATSAQQLKNETDKVINETKQTNSNISMAGIDARLKLEKQLNMAVERKWISQKTKTELINRQKLMSDTDLANSKIMLNEQMRGRAETEMLQLEAETKLLKEELKLQPNKKRRLEIENEIYDKENKMYYIRETVNELTKLGGMGLSLYGTFQAGKALSAYKATQNRTMFQENYGKHGEFLGGRRTYYK